MSGRGTSGGATSNFKRAKFLFGRTSAIVPFALPLAAAEEPLTREVLGVLLPSHSEAENPRNLALALPLADTLAEGATVAILALAQEREGFLVKLLPRRRIAPEDACAALLARGYVDIRRTPCPRGAGTLVLGSVSSSREGALRPA